MNQSRGESQRAGLRAIAAAAPVVLLVSAAWVFADDPPSPPAPATKKGQTAKKAFLKKAGAAKKALAAKKAQGGPGPMLPRELFEKLDRNGDLVIEREEVPDDARAAFDVFLEYGDANKDGKLQGEEFRDLLTKHGPALAGIGLGARFPQLDQDKDGKISKTEFPGAPETFARLDKNEDGFVTRDELVALNPAADTAQGTKTTDNDAMPKTEMAKDEMSKDEAGAAKPAGKAMDIEDEIVVFIKRRFQAMDKNGDGKISRAEFTGRAQRFDEMDKNHDGALSFNELRAGLAPR